MLDQATLIDYFEYNNGDLFWKKRASQKIQIGDKVGHKSKNGYIVVRLKNQYLYAHRIIFMMHHGFYPEEVDHIDGNPSNNCIENLRAATRQQNSFNTKIKNSSSTGVKGVGIHKPTGYFKVSIKVDGKSIHLGYTKDLTEAKQMYDEASKLYHGEFARQ